MKKTLLTTTLLLAVFLSHAQNVGVGTASPGTKLDVNGAFTHRETSLAVVSNAATIPANVSQVQLTGAATATITLTGSTPPNAGQVLAIFNNTTGGFAATLNSVSIPNGQAVEFIYSSSAWHAVGTSGSGSTTVSNTSSNNTLSTTVNGVTGTGVNLINSHSISQNGTDQLISTVNGVATTPLTVALTGDVTGTLGASTVSKITGTPVTISSLANNNVLQYNGTAWVNVTPTALVDDAITNSLSLSGNTLTSTVTGQTATSPAVSSVANTSSTNTLTTSVNGVAGTGVNIINSHTLSQNGTNQLISTVNGVATTPQTVAVTGDVTGNLGASTVSKLSGTPLTITSLASNNMLQYNGTAWVNVTPASIIPATTHTLTTSGNTITSTVNGVGATSSAVTGVSNTSSANTLTTTVNGVTGTGVTMINTNSLSLAGTSITATINGVASNALNISGALTNIFNADGTLTGNRTVTMAGNNLTYSSTTGNMIFSPSSTGKVGIGTASPSNTLSVVAASNPLYLGGLQAGTATDSVLTVKNGVVRQVPYTYSGIKDVQGGLSSGGVTVTPNQTTGAYTGDSIILPPGRWLVTVNMLMEPLWPLFTPSGSSVWLQTSFSNSSTVIAISTDIVGNNTLISGLMPDASPYANLSGTMIINNATAGNKTYYYVTQRSYASGSTFTGGGTTGSGGVAGTSLTNAVNLVNFGSSTAGENSIWAIPIQ